MNFNFDNVKSITHDIASLDDNIAKIDASILAQQEQQAESLKKDGDNKIFFDDIQLAIDSYFKEILALNGSSYTRYLEQTLIDGAKKTQGTPHYPNGWGSFSPKLIDSVNGLPKTQTTGSEIDIIDNPLENINLLVNGFSDGSTQSNLKSPYSLGGPIVTEGGSWAIGQRVIILGHPSLLAKISAIGVFSETTGGVGGVGGITINYPSLTVSIIAPSSGVIPQGAVIRNYFSGFSETERTTGVTQANDVFSGTANEIQSRLLDVDSKWDDQLVALNLNTIRGQDKTNNQLAKLNLESCIDMYSRWLTLPTIGAFGRYCNIELDAVVSKLNDRKSFIQTRPQQIVDAIGSVAQSSDGVCSGSGLFFSLMKWIDLRANVGSGSLSSYYSLDLNYKFFMNEKTSLIAKTSEQSNYFDVRKISDINASVISVNSIAGISEGDIFTALDDLSSAGIEIEVLTIDGSNLIVNNSLDSLSVGAYARIVREK